ncbi:hypothetical protein CerSpe_217380 [Prunus speciosa]
MLNHLHHALRHFHLVPLLSCRKHYYTPSQILSFSITTTPCTHASPTYPHTDLLTLSSNVQTLHQTKQVHASALLNGLLPHSVSLCASLMLSYATFKYPETSHHLFEQTVHRCRTAFLWNTLIRAYSIAQVNDNFQTYNRMVRSGVGLDDYTFPFVLKACSDLLEVKKGMEIHGVVFKVGFDFDVFVGNTLLMLYGSCGDMRDVKRVFDEMRERDVVSWNTVIGVFTANGFFVQALHYYREMNLGIGFKPNLVSVISVLPVCAELEDERMAIQIHCYVVKAGLDLLVTTGNALVDVYGKCGNVNASKQVFGEMIQKNEVSWNAAITSLSYMGHSMEALATFRWMIDVGVKPNSVTISSMLPVLVELAFFGVGKELHGFSIRMGIESDVFIANSLIDMYSKSGRSNEASNVFQGMDKRNIVSWNAMIANFGQNRLELEAIGLVRQMQGHGEIPNSVTFTNLLPACARLGSLRHGKEIHARTVRMLYASDLFVSNALTDMYTKCGRLDLARNVFDRIPSKDVASWNTMILGYGMLGELNTAISLFEAMREDGAEYDSVSYIAVLSSCSHGGLVEKGKKYFEGMQALNIEPTEKHYACMVDLLGRAGLMEEAVELIKGMPIVPDANIWGALLGACRIHGNVELASWAADHLFRLNPEHCGYYILLSNMYAEAGRWDEVNRVRELMKSRGVKKNRACSWVQVQDQVHAFVVGESLETLNSDSWIAES